MFLDKIGYANKGLYHTIGISDYSWSLEEKNNLIESDEIKHLKDLIHNYSEYKSFAEYFHNGTIEKTKEQSHFEDYMNVDTRNQTSAQSEERDETIPIPATIVESEE